MINEPITKTGTKETKQNNVKASDLAVELGISKSLLSDILQYRRRLSRVVIRKLAFRFKVSQELFNKPYNLVPAAAKPAKPLQPISQSTRPVHQAAQAISQPKPKPFGTPNRQEEPAVRLLIERAGMATIGRLKNGKEITIWNIRPKHERVACQSKKRLSMLITPSTPEDIPAIRQLVEA
jgi:transcriptional regulator with XRE-family HTH domain